MQKITISKVETKIGSKSGKSFYSITDDKGASFTTFDVRAQGLSAGTVIEAEVAVSGKYNNIKEFTVVGQPKPATEPQQAQAAPAPKPQFVSRTSPEERLSIERQVVLKCITDCVVAGKDVPKDLLEAYHAALRTALGIAKSRLEKEVENLFPEEKPVPGKTKTDPESLKSFTDLCKACKKDFGLTSQEVLKELNISSWTESSETAAEAYKRITAVR